EPDEIFHDGTSILLYKSPKVSLEIYKENFPNFDIIDYKNIERKIIDYSINNIIKFSNSLTELQSVQPFIDKTIDYTYINNAYNKALMKFSDTRSYKPYGTSSY